MREISWSHNLAIMMQCKDDLEREFYIRMTRKFGWSKNVLIGIVLCKSKDRLIVEYALRDATKPIGVATYKVVRQLPSKFRAELPAPKEIRQLMKED